MWKYIKEKHLHTWLPGYAKHVVSQVRRGKFHDKRHVLFAFCDHYEPRWRGVVESVADARVRAWSEGYPELAQRFRDADGFNPRHTFFFPGEQYKAEWLDQLGDLARRGFGEVELHLHHDGQSADDLRADIFDYLQAYTTHGHFSRDSSGKIRYAFIHGNWALANAREDGRHCGVDGELPLLFDTGCYADFTFPSAPDECQPNIVNQIFWPTGDLSRKRAYEHGTTARVGETMSDRVLMIEGPLALRLRREKIPVVIENAAVTAKAPGSADRVRAWAAQHIHVSGRPEWIFIKVHTHGAPEAQAASILGKGGAALHDALAREVNDGKGSFLHYVTAREMYNVAMAAMDGKSGNPGEYRNYLLPPPPVAL